MTPKKIGRKLVLSQKKIRYTAAELKETIETLLACTEEEINAVYTSSYATVYERVVAGCLLISLRESKLPVVETLLSRVYGKPRETIDVTPTLAGKTDVRFTAINSEDAARAYAEMVRR